MPSEFREKYGCPWPTQTHDLEIELAMIRHGGFQTHPKTGEKLGLGLFEHFMRARELAWPERYRHRWTDLIYNEIIQNIVTILMGSGSSQKTSHASEFCLLDYWAHPKNTLVIISTTTVDKLDLAVYGELKMLHKAAKDRFPFLAGHRLDSKRAITTDNLEEDKFRDVRRGIIGRPCYVGRNYVGLGVYAGVKQERIRFLADELQFMVSTFFDCLPNMFSSVDLDPEGQPQVKVIGSGNPNHDPFSQLSIAAEPVEGWESVRHVQKTHCWNTKFERGRCVNLIGTDSPNFDPPVGTIPRYPRLINQRTIDLVLKRWKKDSLQYYSQCLGKMAIGMAGNRVITKQLCEEHHAFEPALWRGDDQTRVWFLDPAWGGAQADRCMWGWLKFGYDLNGIQLLELMEMEVVPILAIKKDADDQIAEWCRKKCIAMDLNPENGAYDSTGRGTVGAAMARVFGSAVPTPIAFGDRPSQRPVRHDLFVLEPDGRRRHKRCDEEYGKRVTELWFAVHNVIACDQFRGMTESTCREGCMREYTLCPGGKIDVETKDETRERMGESPDEFDALVCGVEKARQMGFKIERLGAAIIENEDDDDFFETEAKLYREAIQSKLLSHQ